MKIDIDGVLAKSDLLAYVEHAGGKPRGNGKSYSSHCPLHGGDNPTAFSISLKGNRWLWHCFTGDCGGGDAITFVQKWQNIPDFIKACEWIVGGAIEDSERMRESAARRMEEAKRDAEAAHARAEARLKELRAEERHIFYHKTMMEYHMKEWERAGIDRGMQSFWTLGGCADFVYKVKGDENIYHTPTLTIPIFDTQRQLLTIQHRLLSPVNPKDKYRPDCTGLGAPPFLALPEMGFDGGIIMVMEGAKKAMVTWTRSDVDWQAIGVMSQEGYKAVADDLKPVGKRVVVIPDPNSPRNPNSLRKAYEFAKSVGGRFLQLPEKIDDLILSSDLKQNDLYSMIVQARCV